MTKTSKDYGKLFSWKKKTQHDPNLVEIVCVRNGCFYRMTITKGEYVTDNCPKCHEPWNGNEKSEGDDPTPGDKEG